MAEDSNWGEDSLLVKIKKEKNKFAAMSTEEKVDYYKSYYLVPTIIALAVIAFVIYAAKDLTTKKLNLMQGVVINTEVNDKADKYLTENLKQYLKDEMQGKEKNKKATYTPMHFTIVDGEADYSDYKNVMSLDTMIQGKSIGYILCDADGLEYMKNQDVGYDLTEVLTDEEIEKMSDKLIVDYSEYKKENVTIGLNIYGTKLAELLGTNEEDCNLILIDGSDHVERYRKFLDYILYE
ncbi:MAG: hypothetical protein E7254_11285 [Lachnospiraceae bacterium]|nr:hypothetical protein [Lachnospiraceae bacterium]